MPVTYYDEISEGYDELHGEEQLRKLKMISRSFDIDQDDLMLDVGCGSGIAADFFPCRYVGLDSARRLLRNVNGYAVHGVAEELPFRDDVFDLVICVSALHNFDDAEVAVEEMKRVGKGRFVITVFKKGRDKEKVSYLRQVIDDNFSVHMEVEDEHDFMFFCTN